MPLLAWYTVSGSPWFLSVSPLGRFRHCPRSGPLSAAVQPSRQWTVRQVAPGVQLFSSSARSPGQLYAGGLELMAESQHDPQVALDAVASWARKWRFTFGIGPTKSAAMEFVPQRHVPPCSVTLAGAPLLVVFEYPHLGAILTPSWSWTPHAQHPTSRGNRLFAQCVAWCKSERLPLRFASTLFLHFLHVAEHLLGPSVAQLCVATLREVPSGLAAWLSHRICVLGAWLARC